MDDISVDQSTFLAKYVEDLRKLGVQSGSVLMVHPALRPFGYVPGGADTIIDGLLTALGDSGTLLIPALSYESVTEWSPHFDILNTPSCLGMISETFRLRRGVLRSMHPTHSVCAVGPLAEDLLSSHHIDTTPCGRYSPFTQLPEIGGYILMLACPLIYNTSMHAIEELFTPPYLYNPPIVYSLTDKFGQTIKKEYRPHNFMGWKQRYDRISNLITNPDLRTESVVGVTSYLLDSRTLWKTASKALIHNRLYFVDRT